MISHEYRCVFVHIPKTAGNSINRVFGVGWEDHKDLQRYRDELPPAVFANYFKFAIVRNPWDRLLSDYNYQRKKSRAPASKLFVFAADGSQRNFAEWAEAALAAPAVYDARDWGGAVSPHIHRWSPQIDWITADGKVRTDFVARLERLPEDFRVVRRHLDLPPMRLPHRNRRLHWHYSHYYDRPTRELVAAYYARDIAEFGYEFEHAFLRLAFNWPGARRAVEAASDRHAEFSERTNHADTACTVSFATARPPSRRRAWPRPSHLIAAAGLAVAFVAFGWTSVAKAFADEGVSVQQSLRRIIGRTPATAPSAASNNLLAQARRLRRTMAELDLALAIAPAAAPGAIITFTAEPTGIEHDYLRANAPAITRSGSGPAPRWWLRRNRANSDD